MNLSTNYLGLKLNSPLVIGASPFADDVSTARLLQEMGAGAIGMRSLFEEQIYLDAIESVPALTPDSQRLEISGSTFPPLCGYQLSPEKYIRQIIDLKKNLSIPIIASLNGCRPGGWIDYASRFENAGADAIELNLYKVAADPTVSAMEVEAELLETVLLLKSAVRIPVAVKLSPYFTSLANFALRVEQSGADGIVLFNRIQQAGLDANEGREVPRLELSDPSELITRLRWLATLSPILKCSLAVTGGVHSPEDAIKAIMTGADAVQVVSVLVKEGPRYLSVLSDGIKRWMADHDCQSINRLRDTMNLKNCHEPSMHERGDYQRILQSWRVDRNPLFNGID